MSLHATQDACNRVEEEAIPDGLALTLLSCFMQKFELFVNWQHRINNKYTAFPIASRANFTEALNEFLETVPYW